MAKLWQNDDELFALAKAELFPAVVGDIMDRIGLQQQFLPPNIRPLDPNMVVIGRALTVLEADYVDSGRSSSGAPFLTKPFGLMLEALDDLKRNEVYVCAGASPTYALWGELMTTRALKLGAAGAVMDGYARDTKEIVKAGFPVFAHGSYAQDQAARGKVIDFRIPVTMGAVRINPGDIVFGDLDGVCVVPQQAEAEVFTQAIEKARGEKTVKEAIQNGMSAKAAFEKYGIM